MFHQTIAKYTYLCETRFRFYTHPGIKQVLIWNPSCRLPPTSLYTVAFPPLIIIYSESAKYRAANDCQWRMQEMESPISFCPVCTTLKDSVNALFWVAMIMLVVEMMFALLLNQVLVALVFGTGHEYSDDDQTVLFESWLEKMRPWGTETFQPKQWCIRLREFTISCTFDIIYHHFDKCRHCILWFFIQVMSTRQMWMTICYMMLACSQVWMCVSGISHSFQKYSVRMRGAFWHILAGDADHVPVDSWDMGSSGACPSGDSFALLQHLHNFTQSP